ncbi:MAG: PrsW family intramembrane metalloprotease [Thermoanaerobaculales bacterium]|nr:PrsW family intramembrane metalloprotease [Thermoanaerobaculales bacterium]
MNAGLRILVGLLPVFSFLLALILLDSFKLVKLRIVAGLIVAGGLGAGASLIVNSWLEIAFDLDMATLVRYVAPPTEEILKSVVIIYLFARHRVAFLVDSAIIGFAVGAGFAAAENIHYFVALEENGVAMWVVRGFGTALMHGSVSALVAIISKQLVERRGGPNPWVFLPGLALAVVLHSAFNHFFIAPTATTVLILIVLPVFFVAVFHFSEARTREWLGTGFDTDAELLESITAGRASDSRIGAYLVELRERFPPSTVVDMVCLLRLRLELSIRAKGILIARQAGFEVPADPDMEGRFTELKFLEHSVGRTGLLAMSPLFHFSDRDLWQYHMIGKR